MNFNGHADEKLGISAILRLINIWALENINEFLCKFGVGM